MGPDDVQAPPGAAARPRAVAIFGSFRYGPYYEGLLAGVVAAADVAGSSVIAVQTTFGVMPSGFAASGQEGVSRAAWDHFDGAIVVLESVSLDYVARLRAAGKFVVAIGQDIRGAHSAITLDNAGGISAAVSHLAEHGHTRIGFVGPTWQADAVERYDAYGVRMEQLGLTPLPRMSPDLSAELSMDEQGYLAAQQFLAGDRVCTAIVCTTDLIALGFVRGLREAGVAVPGDVAIVGIDDVDEAAVSVPPLATIAISFERVGEIAFNVALRGGLGEQTDTTYVVPQRLVPRESCGCTGGSVADGPGDPRSPEESFATALLEAAQEGVLEASVDIAAVAGVARHVVDFLNPGTVGAAGYDGPTAKSLAGEINALCPLDRSVQAAMRAIRLLATELGEQLRDHEPALLWALSGATLDLCDAVRSGQLQRRMADYVELKRTKVSHYVIGNILLSSNREDLRSLRWLQQTHAQAGALGLWTPPGHTDRVTLRGVYDRARQRRPPEPGKGVTEAVEAFPPRWMLRDAAGRGRLVMITQVKFEDSDWGVLAVAGGQFLQSAMAQETFQQWSILMSASLDQERADADLARQAGELTAAYDTEMALLEEVRVSEERYALAAEASRDALWDWDVASGSVFYSSNWKALLGHRDAEIGASPDEWLSRIHPDDVPLVQGRLEQALAGVEEFFDVEHRLRVSTGEYRWMACSGRSVVDGGGRPIRLVGSITDVTARRLLQEQLVQEALFDGLTGLAKSTLFKDRVNQAIELAKRRPGYWFAVLFVDLNGFKAVNDTLGHAAGDELLTSVADRLKQSLRRNDTAARLGGDEFAILLNDVENAYELTLIVQRVEALISAPHQVAGRTATVGAAIGVAGSDAGYATAEEMLHEADAAMYRAKRRSKEAAALPPGRP